MKKPPEPFILLEQARRFHSAFAYLRSKKNPHIDAHHLPICLLSCTASELYLKFLILKHTGTVQRGHNLKNLFRCLPKQDRINLEKVWEKYNKKFENAPWPSNIARPRNLEEALSGGANMYELSRYVWEGGEFLFTTWELPDALFEFINSKFSDAIPK